MFKRLRLGNFKAFGGAQSIPFKPITLIFGPNSSGKSSIIHSLIYMHQALKTGDLDVVHTEKGGDSIDLGGIKQCVFKHDLSNRIFWEVELDHKMLSSLFQIGNYEELVKNTDHFVIRMLISQDLDDQDNPVFGKKPEVTSFEVLANGTKLIKFSINLEGEFKIDLINTSNEIINRYINNMSENHLGPRILEVQISDLLHHFGVYKDKIIPSNITFDPQSVLTLLKKEKDEINEYGKSKNKAELLGVSWFGEFLDLIINNINEHLYEELENIEYLGPLRSYPPRIIEHAEDNNPNYKSGGGFAWKRILEDSVLRERVNKWLSSKENLKTPYTLTVKNYHTIDSLDKYYSANIIDIIERNLTGDIDLSTDLWTDAEMALQSIKNFEDKISLRKELVLTDLRSNTEVTHRDIGIGISQVLPVLVSSLGYENKTIAIEQPEIHLHPAIQAELGDVFIEGAKKNGNTFILETHSEHLILRLLRRIRENEEKENTTSSDFSADDLMIIYVEPGKNGSKAHIIPVNKEGEFDGPWPDGFFAERSKELFG